MSEIIELSHFSLKRYKNNERKADQDLKSNKTKQHTKHHKKISNDDFFTQYDCNSVTKGSAKKKNKVNRETTQNLLNIITNELAERSEPINYNIIESVDSNAKILNSRYLSKFQMRDYLRKSDNKYLDAEQGFKVSLRKDSLSPLYPKVCENMIDSMEKIETSYKEPVSLHTNLNLSLDHAEKENTKFLKVIVKCIKFEHHYAFSLEELLVVKLIDTYNDYSTNQSMLKELSKKVKVIKLTRSTLKNEFIKMSYNHDEDARFDETIRKYTGELLDLKSKHFAVLKKAKELTQIVLAIWSDIETVRLKTKTVATPYVLEIIKEEIHDDVYNKMWSNKFDEEFADMWDKTEYEYIQKYIEYKESKNNFDSQRKQKPKLFIDEETLKAEVETIVNLLVPKDDLTLTLKYDLRIVSTNTHKNRFNSNSFHLRFLIDNTFVCETNHHSIKEANIFEMTIEEALSIQILDKNSLLTICLCDSEEEVSSLNISIGEIANSELDSDFLELSLISSKQIEPTSEYIGSGYSIKEIAAVNKVRLKSNNMLKGKNTIHSKITLKIGWNRHFTSNDKEIIKESIDLRRQILSLQNKSCQPTVDILSSIIKKLYNKDVSIDSKIISNIKRICNHKISRDFSFCNDDRSPEFIRFKLIHMRNCGSLSTLENKVIPLSIMQIPTEQLNCLQMNTNRNRNIVNYAEGYANIDVIDVQRFVGIQYVQRLNENLHKNLRELLLKKTHNDVVRDFQDLNLRSIFSKEVSLIRLANLSPCTKRELLQESLLKEQEIHVNVIRAFNLFDRQIFIEENDDAEQIAGYKVRPLRPFVRISYLSKGEVTATAIGCHPTWNQTIKIKTRFVPLSSLRIDIFDEHKLSIDNDYYETDSAHTNTLHYRIYNKWIASLEVPMYSLLTSGMIRGTFKLTTPSLLLGYEASPIKPTNSLNTEIKQLMKRETSFLSLQITTSVAHLGNMKNYMLPVSLSNDDHLILYLNRFQADFVTNFPSRNISLTFVDSSGRNKCVTQFLQPIPPPDYHSFPKNSKNLRSESAVSKSSGLSKSSSSKSSSKQRELVNESPLQGSGDEKEYLYSTYEGLDWKNGDNQLSKVITGCVRYVSLIPAYDVKEESVVTLLGLELMRVLYGTPLDHTILLASYFLYLGVKCWVAIGQGLPRGLSSYVLIKCDQTTNRVVLVSDSFYRRRSFLSKSDLHTWQVYDAVTGDRFELRDVGCPLKTVDYIFDNENIWVNIQSTQICESVSFDFTKSSDWQMVFDKNVFVMKQPVVTEPTLYSPPLNVERFRQKLEDKIKGKIQKWRTHSKTIWNRYCSNLLRESLPLWEYWSFNMFDPKPPLSQRLKQLMVTYKMYGFPLNMSYVTAKSIISTLKSKGIHETDDPAVEFALAVEVFAYHNNVLSVWVFLASMNRI